MTKFKIGQIVEQNFGLLAGKQRAIITYVHSNGALDVSINGKNYGWSSRFCIIIENETKYD